MWDDSSPERRQVPCEILARPNALSDCSESESQSGQRVPWATSETLRRVNLISATSVTAVGDGFGYAEL